MHTVLTYLLTGGEYVIYSETSWILAVLKFNPIRLMTVMPYYTTYLLVGCAVLKLQSCTHFHSPFLS